MRVICLALHVLNILLKVVLLRFWIKKVATELDSVAREAITILHCLYADIYRFKIDYSLTLYLLNNFLYSRMLGAGEPLGKIIIRKRSICLPCPVPRLYVLQNFESPFSYGIKLFT